MMTTYTRPPEQAGKYRAVIIEDGEPVVRDVWFLPGEAKCRRGWFVKGGQPPLKLDYRPIPGTRISEWPKPINDDGAVRLMCAIIKRAKKDAFYDNAVYARGLRPLNRDKETAIWFLSASGAGRRWLKEEKEFRQNPDWKKLRSKQLLKERLKRAAQKDKQERLEKILWRDYLDHCE